MNGGGGEATVKGCQRDVRVGGSQHPVKGTKGEEMGDGIVEMTVWDRELQESGKTGCTGCMKHVVGISSGRRSMPPFRIGYKHFTKTLGYRMTMENVAPYNRLSKLQKQGQ